MKYKKGDRVRIVSYRTTDMDSNGKWTNIWAQL